MPSEKYEKEVEDFEKQVNQALSNKDAKAPSWNEKGASWTSNEEGPNQSNYNELRGPDEDRGGKKPWFLFKKPDKAHKRLKEVFGQPESDRVKGYKLDPQHRGMSRGKENESRHTDGWTIRNMPDGEQTIIVL